MGKFRPEDVLDFWFPDDGHWNDIESHRGFWMWRMRGEADDDICDRFADLTRAAARGDLDHWAETPRGRMALIIALDQFPRSLWRDTPGAFGQDIKSCRLVLEAYDNGHWDALPNVWEKQFCQIAVSHCEGPDHLARMDKCLDMAFRLAEEAPEAIRMSYLMGIEQVMIVRDVIERFGRHPHRNHCLGRVTTRAEAEYIAQGQFPHQRQMPSTREEIEEAAARIEAMLAERRAGG